MVDVSEKVVDVDTAALVGDGFSPPPHPARTAKTATHIRRIDTLFSFA